MYRIDQDFHEVEYLCDTAKTRYAVYNMVAHSNLLKVDSEKKYLEVHSDVSDMPDMTKRLDRQGTLAISFVGKVPAEVLTSYGAIKIHYGQNNGLVSAADETKFLETLRNTFGLVPLAENNSKLMVVTKLPWRENGTVMPKLPLPTAVLVAPEINPAERAHLQKAVKVVNATFIKNMHPEMMLRGVDDTCKIDGMICTLSQALENYPNLVSTMEQALREDYARVYPQTTEENADAPDREM